MKREGYIIEEIIDWGNLQDSFDTVVRGSYRKRTREGKWLLKHRDAFLLDIKQQIENADIKFHPWHERIIKEGRKLRNIQVFCMKDRILINAVMSVVDRHVRPRLIRTTSSAIKGRGMHELKNYMQNDIKRDAENMRYIYKCDIKKFYDNIPQQVVKACNRKLFKDKRLLKILDIFTELMPTGISIGMRSSQGFGNILMNCVIDHVMKDQFKVKHYYRYCDDIMIACPTKKECWKLRNKCHELIERIGLEIKPSESVFPISEGIDFLGFVTYRNHSKLRKHIKKKSAKTLKKIKSGRRRREIISALYGMAKHCNSYHLLKKLSIMKEIKNFSDMNIKYCSTDGKKQFIGQTVSVSKLNGIPIILEDFETNVKTKHGDDRTVVSFRYDNEEDKETLFKFFTQSRYMLQALQQIEEQDGFPVRVTIVDCPSNGHSAYKFT